MSKEGRGGEQTLGFRVEGRVQGVGFRAWTVRTARALGLRGWVRNLPDGAVEAHVAGGSGAMARMREELGRGPGAARVDRVVELPVAHDLPHGGFEVRG
ncbi:MAG: acylphosphatase [Gemmatimonadetes bacterium]|nr:acylphosphatase [Gemmatimonadota bacterium]